MKKAVGLSCFNNPKEPSHMTNQVDSYVLEVDASFVDEQSVNVFDLYEHTIDKVKAENAKNVFLLSMLTKKSEKLADLLVAKTSECEKLEVEAALTVSYKQQLDEAKTNLDALSEQFTNADVVGAGGRELQAQLDIALDNNKKITHQLAALNVDKQILSEKLTQKRADFNALKEHNQSLVDELAQKEQALINDTALIQNKAKTELSTLKDKIASLNSECKRTENEKRALARRVEVLEADVKSSKAKAFKVRQELAALKESERKQELVHRDVVNDLVITRKDRRYLTMMIDALAHHEFYSCDAGGVYVYSYDTEVILSDTLDGITPCTQYPLGMWRGNNGICSILSVGLDNGEYVLAMPNVDGFPQELSTHAHPPKEDQDAILAALMEFDNDTCNEALKKARVTISEIAEYSNFIENNLLTNKNLIATSRNASGSVLKRTTGKSQKQKSRGRK